MKPGNERAQRKIGHEFGQLLHECVGKFLSAVDSGDPNALGEWRRDLETLIEALAVAAYALHPLAAIDAHALRGKLRAAIGPAVNLGGLARIVAQEAHHGTTT